MDHPRAVQLLNFKVAPARSAAEFQSAWGVRADCYGRHLPQMRDALLAGDALDKRPGVCVLLCTDKRSGEAVGTVRIQTSYVQPLQVESSVSIPAEIRQARRAELTRLAIRGGRDPMVKQSLMKAAWQFCRAQLIDYMVVTARNRALIRDYERLLFSELFGGEMYPMAHVSDIPHKVLANDLRDIESRWRESQHDWCHFMLETWHPDIDLFGSSPVSEEFERELALAA